ncbi:hypothetical protein BDN72DRAFT_844407 [Pluteus cervinus]|uniref:Uncharacterized protein n=1 Tax=Pluteus cervinus TaxID=181527 RepID=A0ACD3AL36_9AGAR|nr:hypothetical protein BDN72DRAFT_844407 [Pluteus cervinus]
MGKVEANKLRLLEEEWRRRGQWPLPERPLQDTIFPIILTCATGALSVLITLDLFTPVNLLVQRVPGRDTFLRGHHVGTWITSAVKSGVPLVIYNALTSGNEAASDAGEFRILDSFGPWPTHWQPPGHPHSQTGQA